MRCSSNHGRMASSHHSSSAVAHSPSGSALDDVAQGTGHLQAEGQAACPRRVGGAHGVTDGEQPTHVGRLPLVVVVQPGTRTDVVDRVCPGGVGPGRRLGQHGQSRVVRRLVAQLGQLAVPGGADDEHGEGAAVVDEDELHEAAVLGHHARPAVGRARLCSREELELAGGVRHSAGAAFAGRAVGVCQPAGPAARVDHQVCRDGYAVDDHAGGAASLDQHLVHVTDHPVDAGLARSELPDGALEHGPTDVHPRGFRWHPRGGVEDPSCVDEGVVHVRQALGEEPPTGGAEAVRELELHHADAVPGPARASAPGRGRRG